MFVAWPFPIMLQSYHNRVHVWTVSLTSLFSSPRMHGKMLLVTFDSDDSAQSHVEALTRELQTGFKKLNNEINSMEETPGTDDSEVRMQVKRQLAKALMGLTMEFRKEETRFLNKVEAQKGLAAGSSLGIVESDSTADLASTDPGFTQVWEGIVSAASCLRCNLRFVIPGSDCYCGEFHSSGGAEGQRDSTDCQHNRRAGAGNRSPLSHDTPLVLTLNPHMEGLKASSLRFLQIMRDLGALVVEQGTLLDRIDHNIQESAVKIEEGTKQIVQAEKTQKSSRMFLCIIALVVLIVVMLIIVIARNAMR